MTGSRFLDPPQITLDAIYGDGTILVPRPSPTQSEFLGARLSQARADASTGGPLAIAGTMPVSCSSQVVTEGCRALLGAAGLPVGDRRHLYGSLAEYQAFIQAPPDGHKLAFLYRHTADESPAVHCWIDPALLSFLNDKSKLHDLVPGEFTPRRSVQAVESMSRLRPSRTAPIVLKGAGPWSSGSGEAVIIARNGRDLARAETRLAGCEAVVVEEFLPLQRTWCLNFATDGSTSHYFGAAEEVLSGVHYHGNWLEPGLDAPAPARDVGLEIVRRASEMGYRGWAGIDMGVTDTGRLVVLDLNFRLCGSTAAVLWLPSVLKARSPRTIGRVDTIKSGVTFAEASLSIRKARDAWAALPLACFEPSGRQGGKARPRFRVLHLGDSRDEVERNKATLEAACRHAA